QAQVAVVDDRPVREDGEQHHVGRHEREEQKVLPATALARTRRCGVGRRRAATGRRPHGGICRQARHPLPVRSESGGFWPRAVYRWEIVTRTDSGTFGERAGGSGSGGATETARGSG